MKKIRVYGINIDLLDYGKVIGIHNITDEEFIDIAEEMGFIWSIDGFQSQFNNLEINIENLIIRFIKNK